MIEETGWIHKRNPTLWDTDEDGKIRARVAYSDGYLVPSLNPRYEIPEHLVSLKDFLSNIRLVEWTHTDKWLKSHEEYERQIDQISAGAGNELFAVAKDGTVWHATNPDAQCGGKWQWEQLPSLPKGIREVNHVD